MIAAKIVVVRFFLGGGQSTNFGVGCLPGFPWLLACSVLLTVNVIVGRKLLSNYVGF